MSDRTTEIAVRVARLLEQQIDVLRAAEQLTADERDVAAYQARDLEIRCLLEQLDGRSSQENRVQLAS